MVRTLDKVLAKLDRPPFVHNFVRLLGDDPDSTAKNIVGFVKGIPPFSYAPAYAVIKDRIQFGMPLSQALQSVLSKGTVSGRKHNEALVKSFYEWDDTRRYSASNIVEFERQWFRASRDVAVPVAPLCVLRESGEFVPVFLCGWGDISFSLLQSRLYLTICDDAFLSLEDFREAPAEFAFFPRVGDRNLSKLKSCSHVRKPVIWKRDQYPLLSNAELNEVIEIFLEGRSIAKRMLIESSSSERRGPDDRGGPSSDQQYDLF